MSVTLGRLWAKCGHAAPINRGTDTPAVMSLPRPRRYAPRSHAPLPETFPARAAHNVEWVCPRYPNCGQDAATFETGPRVSRGRCARRSPHNRRHAASDSHSARPGPFLRNVRRSVRTYLADHHPMGRQRDDGPGSVVVDTTVCRPVVPEPQTTASKMSDTRVCGH
jgi:hypothetical protein